MDNWLKAAALLTLLCVVAYPMDLRVKTSLPDSRQYFCNPCWITWNNESGGGVVRTALGSSNYSFASAQNSTYMFIPSAELLGFNESGAPVSADGNGTSAVLYVPISAKGHLAVAGNGAGEQWFDTSDDSGAGIFPQNWQRKAYSYGLLKNISKSFGYANVNAYSGAGNYSLTGSYASNAFMSYETVLVGFGDTNDYSGASNVMSATLVTALETAKNAGTKVYVPAYVFNKSVSAGTGVLRFVGGGNQPFDVLSELGMVQNGTNYYPLGHDLAAIGGKNTYPLFVQRENPALDFWGWYAPTGTSSYIYLRSSIANGNSGTITTSLPLYRIISSWRVVPSYWHSVFSGNKIFFNPALFALMYNSLDNYGTDAAAGQNPVTVNAYEGTEACGIIRPLANVQCCFGGSCGSTTAVTSATVVYSSGVAPYSNPETELRGDATDKVVFWGSEQDFHNFEGDRVLENWENYYFENMEDTPSRAWLTYSDDEARSARISYAASKGTSDGVTHMLVNYDFYDVPRDIGPITNTSYSAWYNSSSLDYDRQCILGVCLIKLHTCEAGDYWNMTMWQGKNLTHYFKHRITCQNDVLTNSTTFLAYNGSEFTIYLTMLHTYFDMRDFTWYYANAPSFGAFAEQQIGKNNDIVPLTEINYILDNVPMRWLRQFTLAVFDQKYESGSGSNTDSGGFIDIYAAKIHYNYDKFTGGSTSISGGGSGEIACYAPDGYVFLKNGAYSAEYRRNITAFAPVSLGVALERVRPLNMRIHVTSNALENVENARCSVPGYSDSWSTNGWCYFDGVEPNTDYNTTIIAGGETISTVFTTSDFYNSRNADGSFETCSLFDGNYSFEFNIDRANVYLMGLVKAWETGGYVPVANALVKIDALSQRSGADGKFSMILPYKPGLYNANITKRPQINDFLGTFYVDALDCDKENNCYAEFIVEANASYIGGINDDVSAADQAFDIPKAFNAFMGFFLNPTAWVLFLMIISVGALVRYEAGMFAIFLVVWFEVVMFVIIGWLPAVIVGLMLLITVGAIAFKGAGMFSG